MSKLNQDVVESYYEEWTEKYIDDFGTIFQALQTERPEELIEYIAEGTGLEDGMNVLDAGAGICGPAIVWAKKFNVEIEALTISQKQVDLGFKAVQNENLIGTVNPVKGDFHLLETYYSANQFDRIYFLESLVHSHDPLKAIQSAHNVLKEHGILYIKDLFRGPVDPKEPSMIDYPIEKINEQFSLHIRKVGDIINMLTESGFEIEFCKSLNVEEFFDRGNLFTAKHLFHLLPDQTGPWVDRGLTFLHWLEIRAMKRY